MLKRMAAAAVAALVLALGGTGVALAANGADDAPGNHQEHRGGHDRGQHQGHHHGKHQEPGDGHGGRGNEPGDDSGGQDS